VQPLCSARAIVGASTTTQLPPKILGRKPAQTGEFLHELGNVLGAEDRRSAGAIAELEPAARAPQVLVVGEPDRVRPAGSQTADKEQEGLLTLADVTERDDPLQKGFPHLTGFLESKGLLNVTAVTALTHEPAISVTVIVDQVDDVSGPVLLAATLACALDLPSHGSAPLGHVFGAAERLVRR
jgi:hypothetical protein